MAKGTMKRIHGIPYNVETVRKQKKDQFITDNLQSRMLHDGMSEADARVILGEVWEQCQPPKEVAPALPVAEKETEVKKK